MNSEQNSQASLAQPLVGSLVLSLGSRCPEGFVCALQESLFPRLWKFCNQILLTFTVRFPGDSQALCRIPRLGYLLWGLDPSHQCKNFSSIIVLQFAGRPPGGSMAGLPVTSSKRTPGAGDGQAGLAAAVHGLAKGPTRLSD